MTQTPQALPVACSLSRSERDGRLREIADTVWPGVETVAELPDGYALRFPGTDDWTARLAEFVRFERQCCAFLTFELVFEPGAGPIWLRLRGDAAAKEFVRECLLPAASGGSGGDDATHGG